MTRSCCVQNCNNKSHDGKGMKVNLGARFFKFPTWKKGYGPQVEEITKRRRMAWVAAVRRKNITFAKISPFMYVCSRHFHKGQPAYEMMETDPDWAPSLLLGHTDVAPTNTARAERCKRRELVKKSTSHQREAKLHKTVKSDRFHTEMSEEGDRIHAEEGAQTECRLCMLGTSDANPLLEEIRKLHHELNESKVSDSFFGDDDKKVKYYTGLPNVRTFTALVNVLDPLLSDQNQTLTPFQMLLLTFMRLRLDLPAHHLAHLFHVSTKTVHRTFSEIVPFLYASSDFGAMHDSPASSQ